MFSWSAVILGPRGTAWEGGKFKLDMKFPFNYPFRPPQVRFTSPIVHPNVCFDSGEVYMDILGDCHSSMASGGGWSPAWCASAILISIQSLLDDPNTDHSINERAALLYKEDKSRYLERVHRIVQKSSGMAIPEHLQKIMRTD